MLYVYVGYRCASVDFRRDASTDNSERMKDKSVIRCMHVVCRRHNTAGVDEADV